MEWISHGTEYKKGLIRKREGGRQISAQFIQVEKKKNGINLKRIWYQPYTSSFVNCFKFLSRMYRRCKKLRQAGVMQKHWLYYFNA